MFKLCCFSLPVALISRTFTILLLLAVISSLCLGTEQETIKIGIYQNEPKIFLDDNNQPAGFYPEILNYIAQQEDWQLEYVTCEWGECLEKLERGELDIMPDVAWSAERAERFDFNDEVVISSFSRLYANADDYLHSILDLNGKRIAVLRDSFQASKLVEEAKNYDIHLVLVEADSFIHVLELIEHKEVDGGIVNRFVGEQQKDNYKVFDTNMVLFPARLHFASPREKNGALLVRLDEHLTQLKATPNSIYYRLHESLVRRVKRVYKPQIQLTGNERVWIDANKRVRIGVDSDFPPYSFRDEMGRYIGIAPEFLNHISMLTGISFEIVPGLKWSEILEGVKSHNVDVIATAAKTPEREAFLSFTGIYIPTPLVIMTRNDDTRITAADDLSGKKLALVRGYSSSQQVVTEHPDVTMHLVDTPIDGLRAVAMGEADAFVGVIGVNSYLIQKYGLVNLKIAARYELKINGQRFGVRNDWPELTSIMAKAVDAIPRKDKDDIFSKWVPVETKWTTVEEPVELTPEERAWINEHPEIVLGTDAEWRPYAAFDQDGNVVGVEADLIARINQLTGTNIRLELGTWSQMVEKAKDGKIDGLAISAYHKEREPYFLFTNSPYNVSKYIYTCLPGIMDMDDLVLKRVALLRGNLAEEKLLQKKSGIKLVPADNNEEMISLLTGGQVDAVIGDISFRIEVLEKMISDIKIAFIVPDSETKMCYSIRKDWPELQAIINKALSAIPQHERLELMEKWGQQGLGGKGIFSALEAISAQERLAIVERYFGDIRNVEIPFFRDQLTDAEKAWLDEHPVIRVHNEEDWPPFNFYHKDQPAGYSIDYMNLIAKSLGITVEYITGPSWNEFMDMIRKKDLDVMLNIANTAERREYIHFTDGYFTALNGIYSKKSERTISSLEQMVKEGLTLSVPRGFSNHKLLEKCYPEIKLVLKIDQMASIKAVLSGEADAVMGREGVMNYLLADRMIVGIKQSGVVADERFKSTINIGIRKDWPVLRNIIQKAKNAISLDELVKLRRKWSLGGEEWQNIDLTGEERDWLKTHPVIRVVNEPDYPPFDFRIDGKPVGYSIDYVNILAQRLGIKLEFVQDTWGKLLEKAEKKEVDLVHTIFDFPEERKRYLEFTQPYKKVINVIVVRDDIEDINELRELDGRRVALVTGDSAITALKKTAPGMHDLYFDNYSDALKAIAVGKADATVLELPVASYLMRTLLLSNLKIVGEVEVSVRGKAYRLAVRKDWPIFIQILNKAMQSLLPDELRKLDDRWVGLPGFAIQPQVVLTAKEKAWLDAHSVIHLGYDIDWPPIESWTENEGFKGISADYMSRIEKMLGVRIEPVAPMDWKSTMEAVRAGKVDVLSAVAYTPQREEFLGFTEHYLHFPLVIVTSEDVPYIGNMTELHGKKVGVGDGYASQDYISNDHPQIILAPSKDIREGLLSVAGGKTFAFIGSLANIYHIIAREGLGNLKISGGTPYTYEMSIGVRKSEPLLLSVMQKALDAISEEERAGIYRKWFSVTVEHEFDYSLLWKILVVVAIVLSLFLYWNRRLSREVTARQQTEIALQTAKEIAETARSAAESANQAKSIFLANMSHEIRTPMNAVLGFAEILKCEESDPKKVHYIESIYSGGKALLSLINDILDLSKVEAGKLELQYSAVSIDKLLDEIKVIFEQKIRGKGLEFIIEKLNDVPQQLILDETRVRQVLINLLSNAVKFTSSGFIRLSVSAIKAESTTASRVNLSIVVEDSGIGIPKDQCERVFDAFEQTKGQKSKEYGGTGLGLAITRRLVELMDGEIHVESIAGKGASFHIDLNNVEIASVKMAAKTENKLDEKSIYFEPASILIVDDIDYNREMMYLLLKPWEFTIIEAENGIEGLAQARKHKPDLILLDMKMPEMDGYEMSEHIYNDDELKDMIVIAVTASALKQDEDVISKLCDGYLRKPVSQTDLILELIKHLPYTVIKTSNGKQSEPVQPSKIIFPPHEKLIRIIKASKDGNMTELEKAIAETKDMDLKYQPFVEKVEFWIRNLQFEEIIKFLA